MEAKLLQHLILFIIFSLAESKEIYMSTDGNDETGDGSIENHIYL